MMKNAGLAVLALSFALLLAMPLPVQVMIGQAPMCANKNAIGCAVNFKKSATLVAAMKAAGSMQGGVTPVDRVLLSG